MSRDTERRRPVTDAEIAAFHADGVVYLRGILPVELVTAMEGPVEIALTRAESADLSEMGRALAAAGETVLSDGDGQGRFVSGVDHWRAQPEFRTFACESPLGAAVAALLDSRRVQLFEDSVLVKEPNAPERTAWHQDLSYFHVEGEQLCTTWCPLDPTTPETGAVRYVRGSHRWGDVFRPNLFVSTMSIPGTEGDDVPDIDALAAAGNCEIVTFTTEPGDVVVHHARTLHAAGGNRSGTQRRRAISVRYAGDDVRTHIRTGAPLKEHQRTLADGDALPQSEHPVAFRAAPAAPGRA